MKKPFPVEKIKDALLAVEPDLTGPQRQMLMTHYANRIASMERIARFGNYQSYHSQFSVWNAGRKNCSGNGIQRFRNSDRYHCHTFTRA
jgi:hypothetical protein